MEDWLRCFAETDELTRLEYSPAAIDFLDGILRDEPVVENSRNRHRPK